MKLIISIFFSFLSCICFAQSTIVSNGSGSWNQASTWDANRLPADGDIVVINNNHQVSITENIQLNNIVLRIQGMITIKNNIALRINGNGIVNVITGGRICSESRQASSIISLSGVTKFRGSKTFNPLWGEGIVAGLANASSSTGDIDFGGPGFVMGALPATWQDLNVFRTIDNTVQMIWVTSHETGTRMFEVERSDASLQWKKIGSISSPGNQGQENIYDFVDSRPLTGLNYYRIRQIDPDGNSKYTSVRFVTMATKEFSIKGFPNPAINNYRIDFSKPLTESIQVRVVNTEGKTLMQKTAGKGISQIEFQVKELKAGIYFIQCVGSHGKVELLKMMR